MPRVVCCRPSSRRLSIIAIEFIIDISTGSDSVMLRSRPRDLAGRDRLMMRATTSYAELVMLSSLVRYISPHLYSRRPLPISSFVAGIYLSRLARIP